MSPSHPFPSPVWDEANVCRLLFALYNDASLDKAAADWIASSAEALYEHSGFARPAVYMNYASGTEELGARYGYDEWRLQKLKELKTKWDPEGMFSSYHPIPRA